MHHAYAVVKRIVGRAKMDFGSVDEYVPLVGMVQPHQDIHQGRLARAVLSDEGPYRMLTHRQVDMVASQDTRKSFGYASKLEASYRFMPHTRAPCYY